MPKPAAAVTRPTARARRRAQARGSAHTDITATTLQAPTSKYIQHASASYLRQRCMNDTSSKGERSAHAHTHICSVASRIHLEGSGFGIGRGRCAQCAHAERARTAPLGLVLHRSGAQACFRVRRASRTGRAGNELQYVCRWTRRLRYVTRAASGVLGTGEASTDAERALDAPRLGALRCSRQARPVPAIREERRRATSKKAWGGSQKENAFKVGVPTDGSWDALRACRSDPQRMTESRVGTTDKYIQVAEGEGS